MLLFFPPLEIGLWGIKDFLFNPIIQGAWQNQWVLTGPLFNCTLSWTSASPLHPCMFVSTRKTVGGWAPVLFSKRDFCKQALKNKKVISLLRRLIAELLKWHQGESHQCNSVLKTSPSAHSHTQNPAWGRSPDAHVQFLNSHLLAIEWKVKSSLGESLTRLLLWD